MVKASKGHYESAARIASEYDEPNLSIVVDAFDALFRKHSGRDVNGNRTYDTDLFVAKVQRLHERYT